MESIQDNKQIQDPINQNISVVFNNRWNSLLSLLPIFMVFHDMIYAGLSIHLMDTQGRFSETYFSMV